MLSRRTYVPVLAVLALVAGLLGVAPPASAAAPARAASTTATSADPPAGPYTSAVRADNPNAFWRLSGATGVADSLGHAGGAQTTGSECSGCGGRTPGAVLTESADGHRHFDGTYGYFLDKSSTATTTYLEPGTAWTVEAWVRVAAGTTGTGLVYGWGPNVGQSIGITDGKPFGSDHTSAGFLGTAGVTVSSASKVDDGKWHLVDFVRSGTALTLYVDTVPAGTGTTASGGTAYTALLVLDQPAIGEYFSGLGGDNFFGGDVDDVALYPSALDRGKVRTHWTASGRTLSPSGDPIVPAEVLGGTNPAVRNRCRVCSTTAVNPLTGNYTHSFTDVRVPARGLGLAFTRTYNSQDAAAGRTGPLGPGWTTGYGMRLQLGTGGSATVVQENGAQVRFVAGSTAGTFAPAAPRFTATLVHNTNGSYTYQRLNSTRFTFDADGRLIEERDLNGYPVALGYTGAHLTSITASTDAGSASATRALTLAYEDSAHPDLVTTVTDGFRPALHYRYDAAGDLVEVTDMTGGRTTFTYTDHLLRTIRQPAYATSTVTPAPVAGIDYDNATPPRVTRQVDQLGAQTRYTWAPGLADPYAADLDPATLTGAMTVTDAAGHVTVNAFAAGELVTQVLGYGTPRASTWRYTYDPDTLGATTVTDPTGATTVRSYDAHGNLLGETVDPAGLNRRTVWTYNALDRVTSVQEPRSVAWQAAHPGQAGYATTYTYYPAGSTTVGGAYPAGYDLKTVSTPLWDGANAPVSSGGQPVSRTVTFQRFTDGDANPADVTGYQDASGATWTFGYNTFGDVVRAGSPPVDDQGGASTSNVTLYCVDAVGRVVESVSPRGSPGFTCPAAPPDDPTPYTTITSYDPYNRVTSIKDPLYRAATSTTAHRTAYSYDADGRLTARVDGSGRRVEVTWNALGKATAVTDGAGTDQAATVAYGYDAIGDVTDVTDALGHATHYAYADAAHPSSVTGITDALGRSTAFSYDGAGRLASRQDAGGTGACPGTGTGCVAYGYDASGAPTAVDYSDGTPDVTFGYDADGARTAMTDGAGTHAYAYDSLHRMTSASTTSGATTTALQYAYDLRDLPTCVTYPGNHPVSRGYDAAGRLAWTADWVVGSSSCAATKPAKAIGFEYDADSDLTGTTVPSSPAVRDAVGYDATGAPTAITTTATGADTPLASSTYTRDGSGRVGTDTSTPYTYSPLARLTGAGTTAYGYDAAGRPTALGGRGQQFDAADQLCWSAAATSSGACDAPPAGATTYAYTATGARASATTGDSTVALGYDLEHRLTSYGPAGSATAYGYDGDGLRVSRTPASGTATAFTWDVTSAVPLLAQETAGSSVTSYLYGPDGLPVEQVNPDGGVRYLHHDQLGSTRTVTDAAGTVVDTFTYDPYGREGARTGTDDVRLGFAGEYSDPESGLVYLRARHYDPATGQFLTRDPLVAVTGSAYGYAGDDPVNAIDPLGLQEMIEYGSLLGGESGAEAAAFAEGSMVIPDTAVAVTETAAEEATAAAEGAELEGAAEAGGTQGTDASVIRISISRSRYPESAAHIEEAQSAGQPSTLTIDRAGAAARRAEAMRGNPRVPGLDRDEYPPAMTSEGGSGSSVRPIRPGDNRGAGSCIGMQCRRLPDGTLIELGVDP